MSESPRKHPLRRAAGCLIKAPLGCLAFLAGAGVVGVLFLPPVAGEVSVDALEEWFAREHVGTLEIREAWLGSFYGEQRVEGVVLRDPEGREVLTGEVRAPSLAQLLGDGPTRYGPVSVVVEELDLVQGADGRTNLERALERRDDEVYHLKLELGKMRPRDEGEAVASVDVNLLLGHLRWSDERGHGFQIDDVLVDAKLDRDGPLVTAEITGRAAIAGEPGSHLTLFASQVLDERSGAPEGGSAGWSVDVECGPAPTSLPLALLRSSAHLEPLVGERIESFELRARPGKGRRQEVELRLESDLARLHLSGALRPEPRALVGREDDLLQVEFAAGSSFAEGALQQVMPLAEHVQLPSDGHTTLLLSEFALPFDGDLEGLEGIGTFVADDLSYELDAALRERFAAKPTEHLASPSMTVRFDDGQVLYERFGMPAGNVLLRLDGSYDLARDEYELRVKPPGGRAVHVRGKRGAARVED